MKIQLLPTDKIIPYHSNPRKNQPIDKVATSIKEYGFQQPIVVDKDMIVIVGHTRLQAAKKLNIKEVPVLIADLDAEKTKAYRIADNRTNQDAEWDIGLLVGEIKDLFQSDYNLDNLGFNGDEIADFLYEPTEALTHEDEVPEPLDNAVSRLNDVWVLGNHRLICGDSTSIKLVDKLLNKQKVDLVFTDPPYNENYKSRGSNDLLRKGIKNDAMSDNDFDRFIDDFIPIISGCSKSGASLYICCNWKDSYPRFYQKLIKSNINVSSCIVWDKKSGGMGWQDYRYQYEFIIYGFKNDASHSWYGGRTETDIWQCKRETRKDYIHPTQKPVEIIERAIKNSSKTGDNILDIFGGSGSTIIACEKTGRNAHVVDLDPIYVDVMINRWQNYTGNNAIHEETGKTFMEMSNFRGI